MAAARHWQPVSDQASAAMQKGVLRPIGHSHGPASGSASTAADDTRIDSLVSQIKASQKQQIDELERTLGQMNAALGSLESNVEATHSGEGAAGALSMPDLREQIADLVRCSIRNLVCTIPLTALSGPPAGGPEAGRV